MACAWGNKQAVERGAVVPGQVSDAVAVLGSYRQFGEPGLQRQLLDVLRPAIGPRRGRECQSYLPKARSGERANEADWIDDEMSLNCAGQIEKLWGFPEFEQSV